MRLTPDIEALVDAVRESKEWYASHFYTRTFTHHPMWWFVAAVKEVREDTDYGLRESVKLVQAYVYKRTAEGDAETEQRWVQLSEQEKWDAIALVFDE